MKQLLVHTLFYFVAVFAVGFILGTVRVFWLAALLNERTAELIEAPFMLLAVYLIARLLVVKYSTTLPSSHFLWVGVLALVLMLSVEFSVVLSLRGLTISEYISSRDPIAGSVYIFSLIIFMLMPYLLARHRTLHPHSPKV